MADTWLGVFALALLSGCAQVVGIEDWSGNPAAGPEEASGQVSASSSGVGGSGGTGATGGTGVGASTGGGGAGTGAGPTSSSSASASSGSGGATCASLPDGASCGPKDSDRCCSGACVDISSDASHCGGCDTSCDASKTCEPVEQTACGTAPADTSGRCTCTTNAQCPLNQVCDANRCSPDSTANCDGVFIDVPSCPNYCAY